MKNNFYKYLETLSKKELIDLIYKPHRKLKNIEHRSLRKIAIKISYYGKNYQGLAVMENGNTIGNHIKNALMMSTLGEQIVYAGRTDKGVSSVGMIASLVVKSRLENTDRYCLTQEDAHEFNYEKILNNLLPEDIRILGWAPVEENFDARFSCILRKYRYYFYNHESIRLMDTKSSGELSEHTEKDSLLKEYDITKMQIMCDKILELKNFYCFAKHSKQKVKYDRTVKVCRIVREKDLHYLDIQAKSFLHNMVRKIFWAIEQHGKNELVNLEQVGTSDPENLVFYEAVYPVTLNFTNLKIDKRVWWRKFSDFLVQQKIKKLILSAHKQY